jgi:hypothetical protein
MHALSSMAPPAIPAVSSAAVPLNFQHYVPDSVSFISLFYFGYYLILFNYSLFLLCPHLGMYLL